MKILLIGDIVGRPGREAISRIVPDFRKRNNIDFVVANAENIAGGSGLTMATADELFDSKIDVLTSGDHIWKQREIYARLDDDKRILRPSNYPESCPGRGASIVNSSSGKPIGVLNVLGRVFTNHVDRCPFKSCEEEVEMLSEKTNIILVDMHAEATSEKIALGRFLDGKVSAVVGTHTHVQTADEKILPKGTAYITDLGMTGPHDSVIGRATDSIIEHFLSCMPTRFEMAKGDVELQGAVVDIDENTGKAVSIIRARERLRDYF